AEPSVALPYAEQEGKAIRRYFKRSEGLTGPAATEAAFKMKDPQARVIHVAAHNAMDTESLWKSYLDLRARPTVDHAGVHAYLHSSERRHIDLPADLGMLSARDTGVARLKRGEGLMGMSRPFLYAGTPSLVASLWPVADEAPWQLMVKFYGHLSQGMPKS